MCYNNIKLRNGTQMEEIKMKTNEKWSKGSNVGGIHNLTTTGEFRACTATQSKGYKTYKGAVKFMESKGYSKAV